MYNTFNKVRALASDSPYIGEIIVKFRWHTSTDNDSPGRSVAVLQLPVSLIMKCSSSLTSL